MPPSHHTEIERKLDVPCDAVAPDLRALPGVHDVGATTTLHLAADYWDTRRLDLARAHLSLRRRTGGTDAGWHLKVGVGPDARAEHACELGHDTTPPDALLDLVRDVVGGHPLHVVARIDTRRDETPLLGPTGAVLARFCDDLVASDTPPASPREPSTPRPGDAPTTSTTRWREWEVELGDGDRDLLAATSTALLARGAHQPRYASKLAHALADRLEPSPPPGRRARRRTSTTTLLRRRLRLQLDALEAQADGVRAGDGTAVHDMRIAIRRLRAALRTFEPVLEVGATRACSDELRWLGTVLGSARDAQVMRERLISELPDHSTADGRISAHLTTLVEAGQQAAADTVGSPRYERLLDDLEVLASHPPARPEGSARGARMAPGLLARDARRFLRASRRARRALPPGRDAALHEARKKAKQLRYGAESVTDVCGTSARKVARAAGRVQDALGAHQDAVVARDLLRHLAGQARAAGEDVTPYDGLRRVEVAAAADAVRRYDDELKRLRKVLRRRIGGLQLAER